MSSDVILLKTLADELGLDRSNMRRYVIKNGVEFLRVRTLDSRGQLTLALTPEDAETIRELRRTQGYTAKGRVGKPVLSDNGGWFYIIQLVPDLEAERVKLGYASDVGVRLTAHQTAAPTAALLKSWPCKRNWELAAIASITREDCKQLSGEVFIAGDLDFLVGRGDAFFAIMPEEAHS